MFSASVLKKALALFVTLLVLLACQAIEPTPTPDIQVTDIDSTLLDVLMKGTDLTENWETIAIDINQKPVEPSNENGNLIEEADILLAGDYGAQGHYIDISHLLMKYQDVSPGIQLSNIHSFEAGTPFYPHFPSFGLDLQSNCERDANASTCDVMIDYGSIISRIVMYAPNEMTDQEIEVMLNQVLENIDARVRDQLLSK
jgi:hypothetical protein